MNSEVAPIPLLVGHYLDLYINAFCMHEMELNLMLILTWRNYRTDDIQRSKQFPTEEKSTENTQNSTNSNIFVRKLLALRR